MTSGLRTSAEVELAVFSYGVCARCIKVPLSMRAEHDAEVLKQVEHEHCALHEWQRACLTRFEVGGQSALNNAVDTLSTLHG